MCGVFAPFSELLEASWLSRIEIWGARFTSIFSVFSVKAGWIAEMLFLFILLYNGQNMAEYEAYWLMGVPIINLWVARFTSTFSVFPVMGGCSYFSCCSLLILLCNEHNKAEYEAYWLISVPIINP